VAQVPQQQPISQETLVYADPWGSELIFRLRGMSLEKDCRIIPTGIFFSILSSEKERSMFRKNALLKNALSFCAVLCLVMGALSFTGCPVSGGGGSGGGDDDKLNDGLIGTWDSGYDGYEISSTAIIYRSTYDNAGFTGSIQYIYNFSETAGVIIVKYTAYDLGFGASVGQFQGVYFGDLTPTTVKLGSAYEADYSVVEVDTLAEAKEKFKPENISLYGGELGNASPQTRK
jgi:hypothetical protein